MTGPEPTTAYRDVRVVDVHAHVLLPGVDALVAELPGLAAHRALEAARNGPEALAVNGPMIAQRIPALTDPERRFADMDAAGIDVQVVSPSPSHYHYWTAPDVALAVCREANRAVEQLVADGRGRLRGLGLVPLQHPERCVEMLDDAVLGRGLAGVEISSHAPDPAGVRSTVELSDERLEPLWARAAELGAVMFLHPFGCTLDERLDRFYLSNVVGQPVENATALSHLIFSGVLDRHPELIVLAAHGGGYLPTYLGRSDHAWQVRPDARGCRQPPSSYLPRLWFDSLVHTPGALSALIAAVGADRVLLGSDYPFDMGVPDPLDRLHAASLPPDDVRAVAGGNARRLGLDPASDGARAAVPVPHANPEQP